jgi:hypothetical protein
MPSYFMEIEYTRADGTTYHEGGTHVITWVDGRFGAERATDTIVQNARFIAADRYPQATLVGVQKPGDYSRTVYPLPDGSRNVTLTPMTADERKAYRADGGYVHP